MVKPDFITITAELVGQNQLDLPELAGYDLLVQLSVIGTLNDVAVEVLNTGGFKLKGTKKFQLEEVYTWFPTPKTVVGSVSRPLYPVSQYPHRMVLTTVESSTQDENGNWQPGNTATSEQACRAEPNSKNVFITTADGTALYYDYTVFMPLPAATVSVGTKIEVYSGDDLLSVSTVKRFSRGQQNARLWL